MKNTITLSVLILLSGLATAQTETTIHFDNAGLEKGVTAPGTTSFSYASSRWSGGTIDPTLSPPMRSSGGGSYAANQASQVVFLQPVDRAKFFFVHSDASQPGKATAFGVSGHPLGHVESRLATVPGDAANFVSFDPVEPIARIAFSSAVVDDFLFVTQGDCIQGWTLCGDKHLLSISQGDKQVLTLDAGQQHAFKSYFLLASASGTTPGIQLDGAHVLPLNMDSLLLHTRVAPNTMPLARSFGLLDIQGRAQATFYVPAGSTMFTPGTTVHLSYLVRGVGGFDHISKPEHVTMVP